MRILFVLSMVGFGVVNSSQAQEDDEECACLEDRAFSTAPEALLCRVIDRDGPRCHLRWFAQEGNGTDELDRAARAKMEEIRAGGDSALNERISRGMEALDSGSGALEGLESANAYDRASAYLIGTPPSEVEPDTLAVSLLLLTVLVVENEIRQQALPPSMFKSLIQALNEEIEIVASRYKEGANSYEESAGFVHRTTTGCFEIRLGALADLSDYAVMIRTPHAKGLRC